MRVVAIEMDFCEAYQPYLSMLCKEKVQKIESMVQPADRLRSVCGELLVRKVISEGFNMENRDIYFAENQYGKPYFPQKEDFHFNISHSGKWVLGAFASVQVGVDVEEVHRPVDREVAALVLSPAELARYRQLEEGPAEGFFFRTWTLKESLVKAMGCGFYMEPSHMDIHWEGDTPVRCVMKNGWQGGDFREYFLSKEYRAALCVLDRVEIPLQLEQMKMKQFKEWLCTKSF